MGVRLCFVHGDIKEALEAIVAAKYVMSIREERSVFISVLDGHFGVCPSSVPSRKMPRLKSCESRILSQKKKTGQSFAFILHLSGILFYHRSD